MRREQLLPVGLTFPLNFGRAKQSRSRGPAELLPFEIGRRRQNRYFPETVDWEASKIGSNDFSSSPTMIQFSSIAIAADALQMPAPTNSRMFGCADTGPQTRQNIKAAPIRAPLIRTSTAKAKRVQIGALGRLAQVSAEHAAIDLSVPFKINDHPIPPENDDQRRAWEGATAHYILASELAGGTRFSVHKRITVVAKIKEELYFKWCYGFSDSSIRKSRPSRSS
jgi:hypothetical protein